MIALYHPGLPPSANNAYVNLPRGGRRLSKDDLVAIEHADARFARDDDYERAVAVLEQAAGLRL